MGQHDKETTGQQVETQHFASDNLDRKREYHYETIDKCWYCKGTGKVTGAGTGARTGVRRFIDRVIHKETTCGICNGSGRVRKKKMVTIELEPYNEQCTINN